MRTLSIALVAVLLSAAALGQAAEKPLALRLSSGTEVVIGPDPAGQMRMFGSSAQPLSAGEIDMVQRFVREHPEAFGPRAAPFDSNQWIRPVDSNRIRFRFLPFASGTEALLNTENGTNQSYSFKARIERGSKSVTTDVCQLVPAKRSVEHWPYPLDWIEITDMHVVPYDETELPRCE